MSTTATNDAKKLEAQTLWAKMSFLEKFDVFTLLAAIVAYLVSGLALVLNALKVIPLSDQAQAVGVLIAVASLLIVSHTSLSTRIARLKHLGK